MFRSLSGIREELCTQAINEPRQRFEYWNSKLKDRFPSCRWPTSACRDLNYSRVPHKRTGSGLAFFRPDACSGGGRAVNFDLWTGLLRLDLAPAVPKHKFPSRGTNRRACGSPVSHLNCFAYTEMVRPGGVQHQSGQHRAAFRQAASAKVLVRLSKHGGTEEALRGANRAERGGMESAATCRRQGERSLHASDFSGGRIKPALPPQHSCGWQGANGCQRHRNSRGVGSLGG